MEWIESVLNRQDNKFCLMIEEGKEDEGHIFTP